MLSKFPNKTLKVGAKVSLSPESQFAYGGQGSPNPTGIVGVVVDSEVTISFAGGRNNGIKVEWENGTWNNYRKSDYDLIAEGEPGFLEI